MSTRTNADHLAGILVQELDRDRFARVARIRIGQKSLTTPNFLPRIASHSELRLLMTLRNDYPTKSLGGVVVRFTDAPRVLPRRGHLRQLALDNKIAKDRFDLFFEGNVLVIDPATEYLYYKYHMGEFQTNSATPRLFLDYLDKLQRANAKKPPNKLRSEKLGLHSLFWKEIVKDDRSSFPLVDQYFKYQQSQRADLLLAPVPYIITPDLLPAANRINFIGSQLAKGKGQFASYYLVNSQLLSNSVFIESLKDSLMDGNRIVFLKFKGLDLTRPERDIETENFRDFMSTLSYISKESPHKAFCLLEAGPQLFPCAAAGFDLVSSTMNGFDSDGGFTDEHPSFGAWRDYNSMIMRKHSSVIDDFDANHGHIPCPCYVCKNTRNFKEMSVDEWNDYRRLHNTAVPDKWLDEIAVAIEKRQIELARDRLVRSRMKVLAELISRA